MVVGEAAAGFISGIASRIIAKILKDEKRDNELSKGISTGTFFGGRALIRGAAQLAGIPRPIARIIASIGATAFSESAKVAARSTAENRDIDNDNNDNNDNSNRKKLPSIQLQSLIPNMKQKQGRNLYGLNTQVLNDDKNTNINKKKPLITAAEVTGDVSKWVIYDLLLPFRRNDNSPLPDMLGASAEVGNYTIHLFYNHNHNHNHRCRRRVWWENSSSIDR